jgi:hypothetical protein
MSGQLRLKTISRQSRLEHIRAVQPCRLFGEPADTKRSMTLSEKSRWGTATLLLPSEAADVRIDIEPGSGCARYYLTRASLRLVFAWETG